MKEITPLHQDITPEPVHELPRATPASPPVTQTSPPHFPPHKEEQSVRRSTNYASPLLFGVGIFIIGVGFWFKSIKDTAGIGELFFALFSFFGGLLCFFGLIFLFTRGSSYEKKVENEARAIHALDQFGLKQKRKQLWLTITILLSACLVIIIAPDIGARLAPDNEFVSLMMSLRLVGIIAVIIIAAELINTLIKLFKITLLLRSLRKSKE